MENLFRKLDQTEGIEDRKKIISEYLESLDITTILHEGCYLSEENKIPFKDNEISFPFIVGRKYLRNEPYSGSENCPAYVIGIVHSIKSIDLLIVEPDNGVGYLPRNWMEPPEVMLQRRK